MKGFWGMLKKPIYVLAPMADVTDAAFRRIIAKYSKVGGGTPYVTYTEFVSADGLALAPEEGRQKLLRDLAFSEGERPIVAQFFSAIPEHMEKAAKLASELGFDGVDINMGCPADAVVRQGAGAELIKHPELAQELIAAAKQGAGALPVSVKTRLGYNTDILEEWLPILLKAKPEVVTIHARTRKEMSAVPARWERIARAVEIRNEQDSDALIIGNGDLKNIADAKEKVEATGADGAMLGRAIFGNPWLFSSLVKPAQNFSIGSGEPRESSDSGIPERLRVAVEHTKLFEKLLGDVKNFALMKKHFKAYAEGFPGAKELRVKLMETSNAHEIEEIVEEFLKAGVY
ncbi:MAG TPA: tRNA-dihydrouridine synthase [Candidatus Paceibacterota bacterium]|nr:tRNA-dihydrouridine synthase [Candidatus Paceibacterota bacterium]